MNTQFFQVNKNKIILSVFILLVSLIYGLPHILLSIRLGASYTPFSLSPKSPIASDETYGYVGFANHIYKGNLLLKEAYVYEYRNFPTPLIADNIPAVVYAFLGKVLGSLEKAYIAADFIFPAIVFLMIYMFLKMFIKNTRFVLAVAFLTTIARDLISVIPYPQATIRYLAFADYQDTFLHLSRSPHPQFSLIVLLGATWSLIHLVSKPKSNGVIPGILFGLLFYTYMFYFSYFSLFFFLVFLFFIFKKDILILKKLVIVGFIAALVGSYYFWNVFNFYQTNLAIDFAEKMSRPQFPVSLTLLRYLIIAVLLFLTARKRNIKIHGLFLFIVSGVLIIPLVRLISDRDLTTFHYVRFALMPFATMAFLVAVFNIFINKKIIVSLISITLTVTGLFLGLKTQITASEKIAQYHVVDLKQGQVFDWINNNTNKDDVIGSLDVDFNRFASVYLKNWVYFPFTSRTIMPTHESGIRYAILSNILGIDTKIQKNTLDERLGYIFRFRAYNKENNIDLHSKYRLWLESEVDRLSAPDNLENGITMYKLDYVVVTPQELRIVKPDPKHLKSVATINGYLILKNVSSKD